MKEKKLPLLIQKILMIVGFPIWFPITVAIGFITLVWALLSALVEILLESETHE